MFISFARHVYQCKRERKGERETDREREREVNKKREENHTGTLRPHLFSLPTLMDYDSI